MTDRPNTFVVRSSDDRRLAVALLATPSVFSVDLSETGLSVRTSDRGALARILPRVARELDIRLREIRPTDDSLESVFSYLVAR
jgi:ABC-2 type transport system ATP-binding protein